MRSPSSSSSGASPAGEGRRSVILHAALRVVAAGGIDAVTHRRVAAEAGVALGSTTYYFGSRDEILLEAFRHYIAVHNAKTALLAEQFPKRNVAAFIDLLVASTRRQFEDSAMLLAEYELILFAARNPQLAEEYRAWQRQLAGQVAERLEQLGVDKPIETSRTLLAALRGFELDRLARADQSFEELRHRLEVLLHALLPDKPEKKQRPRIASRKQPARARPARRRSS